MLLQPSQASTHVAHPLTTTTTIIRPPPPVVEPPPQVLSSNKLSGVLPNELERCEKLQTLDLQGNCLETGACICVWTRAAASLLLCSVCMDTRHVCARAAAAAAAALVYCTPDFRRRVCLLRWFIDHHGRARGSPSSPTHTYITINIMDRHRRAALPARAAGDADPGGARLHVNEEEGPQAAAGLP